MYSIGPDLNASPQSPGIKLTAVEVERAFERPIRKCQQGMLVVNVAAGCSFGCLFCPLSHRLARTNEVQLRVNLPAILEAEIQARKKAGKLPRMVFLNTTTDLFQPIGALLALTHEVIRILLSEGIDVAFQSRGLVPEGFGELFSSFPGKVHAQVSLFAMRRDLARLYEPGAPDPLERLESIRRLAKWGVDVRGRIEPLIPFISDTAGHMDELLRHFRSAGVQRVTAAYLILRPQILDRLQEILPAAHFHLIKGSFRGQAWQKEGIYSQVRLLPQSTRTQGFERLRAAARRADMAVSICACHDPISGEFCWDQEPAANDARASGQLDLFSRK